MRPGFVVRFRRRRVALLAFWFLMVLFFVAVATFITSRLGIHIPFDPDAQNMSQRLSPPGWPHVLGTDQFGRDVFARILNASYISMFVGFLAVAIELALGVLVGAAAGYFGGWIDNVLMRLVDALLCIPSFLLILTLVAIVSPSIWVIIAAIGVLSWMELARLVRAEFLTLREMDYVAAARALGVPAWRIILSHLLPNSLAPVLVSAVLGVAGAILTEAGLSFLGFGVQPPQASWGNIITDGKTYLLDAWWLIIWPGVAILLTTMAFYLTGEGIREVLDPKEGKRI
ncbi:MAG: ABC transporter permease [Phycisphaerae bacterium]|nr:ABC transporter permease [Phycisphaerae bacterium]